MQNQSPNVRKEVICFALETFIEAKMAHCEKLSDCHDNGNPQGVKINIYCMCSANMQTDTMHSFDVALTAPVAHLLRS